MEVSGVNKSELIDAVTDRVAVDRKTVTSAVDVLLETVTRTVANGERVVLTGFGSFEKKDKPARTGRNPTTGATIRLKKTSVPRFKAGAGFSDVVSGAKKLQKIQAKAKPAAGTARTTARAAAGSAAGTAGTAGVARRTAPAATGAARSGARVARPPRRRPGRLRPRRSPARRRPAAPQGARRHRARPPPRPFPAARRPSAQQARPPQRRPRQCGRPLGRRPRRGAEPRLTNADSSRNTQRTGPLPRGSARWPWRPDSVERSATRHSATSAMTLCDHAVFLLTWRTGARVHWRRGV